MSSHKYKYTHVETRHDFEGARDIWQCNDCGAYARTAPQIKHHKSCNPGESEKLQRVYEEFEDDDDEMERLRLMQDPICGKHHF